MNNIELYNGDCLDVMKDITDKSVDMILADLPYGTTKNKWDSVIDLNLLWEQYNRIIKDNGAIVLFGSEPFSSFLRLSNIDNYKYDIYWEKERLTNICQVKKRVGKTIETISIFYKKQCTYNPQMQKYVGKKRINKPSKDKTCITSNLVNIKVNEYHDNGLRYPTQVWKYKRDILTSNLHPAQKPILLLEDLIKTYSNEGDLVLDNCMGSGSTGVACKNLNRRFIGIEKDKGYFEIAKNRIFDNDNIGIK